MLPVFRMAYLPFVILLSSIQIISAVPWAGPDATLAAHEANVQFGWTPRPTSGPAAANYDAGYEYFVKRQAAPPNYWCGFVTGDAANNVTCAATAYCQYNTDNGGGGCCRLSTGCTFPTTCYPRSLTALCGSSCQIDPYVTVCTDIAEPYCGRYQYTGSGVSFISLLGCYSYPFTSLVGVVATTTEGILTSTRGFTFTTTSRTSTSTSSEESSTSSETTSSTTTTTRFSPTLNLGGGSTADATSAYTATLSPSGGGGGTPVGPIVGGVVGGVAVLALLALGAFLLMRKRKKDQQAAPVVGGPPPPMSPAPMSPQTPYMAQQQAYSPPAGGWQSPPPQGYPPPQQYGQQPYAPYQQPGYGPGYNPAQSPPPVKNWGNPGGPPAYGGGVAVQEVGQYAR